MAKRERVKARRGNVGKEPMRSRIALRLKSFDDWAHLRHSDNAIEAFELNLTSSFNIGNNFLIHQKSKFHF